MVATVQGMRGSVGAVYDLTYLYVTPARGEDGARGGKGETKRDRGRVPSLGELVGTRDLAREGYEFRIHFRR
jgi:hypothetical protein